MQTPFSKKRWKSVSYNNLQIGDVITFNYGRGVAHIGIYIGNGQYIHAPQTGDVVKIASNVSRFTCAVRPY